MVFRSIAKSSIRCTAALLPDRFVGDQLPTVRQLAVDLSINPNTVVRAYRELELGGLLETHQGTGTFISAQKFRGGEAERARQLTQIVGDCVARAGAAGFKVKELIEQMAEWFQNQPEGDEVMEKKISLRLTA